MNPLTDKQRQVLDFIVECQRRQFTPSLREIGDELGFSLNAAKQKVDVLRAKGYLAPDNRARTLIVLDTGKAATLWGEFQI